MIYVGIDPGAKGGWTIVHNDGSVDCYAWDNDAFVKSMQTLSLYEANQCRCALEKVGAMPKQGVSSTWKFAEEYGFIKGVLSSCGIPYQTVPPQTWKKSFSLLHQDKNRSIEVAQQLFPDVSLLATERSRKPSDGMAESLLLAEYARRHF